MSYVNANPKAQLDFLASGKASISEIMEILKSGPSRTVSVTSNSVELIMHSPRRIYQWEVSDPRTAVSCLVATGEYEELESQLLTEIARRSKVVIDVGANVGYYSVNLGKELPASGVLIAVEPVFETFNQLQKNIELNNLAHVVKPVMEALADAKGSSKIFIPDTSGSSAASTRNLHEEEGHRTQTVLLNTLDNLMSSLQIEECDLIKIDVEGAEFLVLQGASDTIKKHKPIIFAELLRKWSSKFSYHPNSVLQFLADRGYSCWGVSPQLRHITQFTDMDQETNFIFVHTSDKHGVVEYLDGRRSK